MCLDNSEPAGYLIYEALDFVKLLLNSIHWEMFNWGKNKSLSKKLLSQFFYSPFIYPWLENTTGMVILVFAIHLYFLRLMVEVNWREVKRCVLAMENWRVKVTTVYLLAVPGNFGWKDWDVVFSDRHVFSGNFYKVH